MKHLRTIFVLFILLALTLAVLPANSVSAAGTCFVDMDAVGTNDGSSWTNAYTGLQSALEASPCTEVWVAAGTYKPTAGADRDASFRLIDGVALYGGFAGTETLRTQRNPAANITILSGDIGTVSDNSDNSYHVVIGATGATLDGFTITAGNSATDNFGGGMYNGYGSNPTLTNVTFSNNSATHGGGMYNHFYGCPTLTNVTFSGNSATYGGGMYNDPDSCPTLTNVTFNGNSATTWGGGMYNWYSNPTLTNVTFKGNSATYGGGMYNGNSSNPQIRNTIFWDNAGAQIYNDSGGTPSVSDSVVQGGCPAGSTCTNIITTDPMLGTLGDYGGFTHTIPLQPGSSAINTGNDDTCAVTDQRGITRPQGAHCDIGAYEVEAIFTNCASQTEIPAAECDALVALYNSTNGASWTDKTGWLQTDTPCSWYGVNCESGNVAALFLSGNNLSGSIPTQLGNLTNLTMLYFLNNKLSGSIPTELGSLINLTTLEMSANQLSGSIPTQLGNLTNITYLRLDDNQLTGSIPTQLGNLTNLNSLFLSDNHLSGSIPTQLGNLTNLWELVLYSNQLSGSIPTELGNLTNLMVLSLGDNQLSGSIPTQLGNLTNLVLLSLDSNQLSGSIPTQLGNLTKLWDLGLSSNQLSGSIPIQLGSLTNLTGLNLFSNQLSGSIPTQLGNLTNLTMLSLQSNRLSGEFPTSITNLVNLTIFTFDCRITSTDPTVIAFVNNLVPGWQNNICPVVISITRANPNPTAKANIQFTVTFSESVTGVDNIDFTLTTTGGITGASVTTVSGSETTYTVTTMTGTGDGTLRLNVVDNNSIINALGVPLDGAFTDGQAYAVNKTITDYSAATSDGWVLESTETSGVGGSLNATLTTLNLGDDNAKKQYRGILSFNTASLPDDAVITKVTLKVKKQGITGGGDPVTTFQGFMLDIKKGFFGTTALQTTDFQAAASKTYGPFMTALSGGWYSIDLTPGKGYINKMSTLSGLTQIRLRFKLDDNNNAVANYLSLYSGNAPAASRPQLIIQYYIP